ncbi:hypothetical protein CRE_06563 [Caenorhabditis remanei]|uniref:Uncharacterized protein n=1 Tax=Caenorhabditis remanei TaxID=31234 RepID=E3M1J6_CAERE|nr:hypothetical protein CRE_06563 [Caenorhabditis remanei]
MSTPMEVLENQLRNFVLTDGEGRREENPIVVLQEENQQLRQLLEISQQQVASLEENLKKMTGEKTELDSLKVQIEDSLHLEIQNNEIARTAIENLQGQVVWLSTQLQEIHYRLLPNQ